ncbi:unnamed protein product [Penicillium roqueforti FM164]|uniref:Genomic scaffold, ProqFM164S01 n=1 Tax=Penicillium roqueforti (strain FM164) TaxID=1365484 RepID=W6QFQ7_PENRF|nr:unnamed protein product [Penicillium roqueforti FM164]
MDINSAKDNTESETPKTSQTNNSNPNSNANIRHLSNHKTQSNPEASKVGKHPNQQIRPHRRLALTTCTQHQPPPTRPHLIFPVSATPIAETPLAQRINAHTHARTHHPNRHTTHEHPNSGSQSNATGSRLNPGYFDDKTFLLAGLLHDIRTAEANITRLGFEYLRGVLALRVLQNGTESIIAPVR